MRSLIFVVTLITMAVSFSFADTKETRMTKRTLLSCGILSLALLTIAMLINAFEMEVK